MSWLKHLPIWTLFLGIFIPNATENHTPTNTSEDAVLIAELEAAIRAEMVRQEIVGAAVGIVKDGRTILTKGYGYQDLDHKKAVSSNTVFRWASISKTLNAVAAFQLIEDDKITLDTRIHTVVDNWSNSGDKGKITLGHTMSNMGGIQHYGTYNRSAYTAGNNSYNSKQSVAVFKNQSLLSKPGEKYKYSTFSHNLAGAALDNVAPNGYVDWVEDKIADPLNMSSLTPYSTSIGGFDKDCSGALKTTKEGKITWKLPGGGWASNIKDLTKFMKGMMNGTLLDNTSALWDDVENGDDNYRYGVDKYNSGTNLRIQHGGAHDDVRTILQYYPNRKIGVCIMTNGGDYVNVYQFAHVLRNILLEKTTSYDPRNKCPEDDGELKSTCGGTYAGVWRKTDRETVIRKGYGHDEFYEEWKTMRDRGYHCSDFETYLDGTKRKWDGVFVKQDVKQAMWRGAGYDKFKDKWDEFNADGYRLIDLETYMSGSTRVWAGLWKKGTGKYAMYRGQSQDDFGDKRKELQSKGYKLIDIETYMVGSKRKWAGVWREGEPEKLNRNYDTDDFKQLRRDRRDAGYKLIDVETYKDGGKRKWAGIWIKSSKTESYLLCNLVYKYNDQIDDGYQMIDLERY